MQKITPFLWFDADAEEAMNFYVSVFGDAKVLSVNRCGDAGPGPKGSVMTASFLLHGQEFVVLNGGPQYSFTPAVSFVVNCETQQEVDHYWERLCEGGEAVACGWLRDKFGLSWQIVPTAMVALLTDPDPARAQRTMRAMMQMKKLDLAVLQQAHRGD